MRDPTRSCASSAPKFVGFPYAGGGPTSFDSLRACLPVGATMDTISYPGRGRRYAAGAPETMDELVADALGQCGLLDHAEVVLVGHSFGALAAFVAADKLTKMGKAPEALVVLAQQPPHMLGTASASSYESDDEILRLLSLMGRTPQRVLDNSELMELYLPAIRADLALEKAFEPTAADRLTIPIIAVGATEDLYAPVTAMTEWNAWTRDRFTFCEFPGAHFSYDDCPEDLMISLSRLLAAQR